MTQRLLLVDDDPAVLAVTTSLLESPQRTIRVATSGEQALELLAAEPADIVVLDVDMPGLSGWDTLTAIRRAPALRDTRVILYTATEPHPTDADHPAPDGVIRKNSAILDLIDAINAPLVTPADRTHRFERRTPTPTPASPAG
jgi:CheY-like chemotaxis protein